MSIKHHLLSGADFYRNFEDKPLAMLNRPVLLSPRCTSGAILDPRRMVLLGLLALPRRYSPYTNPTSSPHSGELLITTV